MAASGSTSNVPEGFHYETRYVLLCYLGLPPRPRYRPENGASGEAAQETAVDKTSRMKEQIEEQLKQLEEEITVSFPSTGFDRHTSPVFSPANPENTIEDSLAMLGDRVAQVLDTHLTVATQTLLSGQLDYEDFQSTVKEISSHSEGGWSKVLVPLVLLQALHCKGHPLASLLSLGERYLVEVEADFIIQQGGWSAVFRLEDVEEPGALIAEDSNDIYILSGEQGCEQLSPPESLLISVADSSGLSSWHTESLPVSLSGHESWAKVGTMEPEDAKSVDSGEGVASAEEHSENNSSNSDIVHVEREEAELLEEGEAVEEEKLQESMLSVLGTESELEALGEELRREASSPQQPVSEAPESLMSLEEQIVILEAPPILVAAVPPVYVEPKSLTSSCPTVIAEVPVDVEPEYLAPSSFTIIADAPVDVELECSVHPSLPIAASPQVLDPKPEPQSAQPEPVLAPVEPQILRTIQEPEAKSEPQPEAVQAAPVHEILPQAEVVQANIPPAQEIPSLEPQNVQETSSPSQVSLVLRSVAAPEQEILPQELQPVHTASTPAQEPPAAPAHTQPVTEPVSSELPVLLYGGAALVAIAALVAYGVLAYRKKY
ncbi:bcl-2-like protein 13 isoform X1 [Ictalurus furcatus]|uniref:bcl-2-like protein 13 isoform X1 n=2 Tax=Ictalurus furcatus TaxID=66913 RepID=UPI002350AD5F|nr:bcl-2-like protein 13 isoform X1 [Ictalurus furcatus]XP_053479063.1 bcl-2-like protein 13 isoform X1 [Ictalurus furcatus]